MVTTYNIVGYLDNSYTITGNTIELSVCYWFGTLQPVYEMSNDFFIPVADAGIYTIIVKIFHSSSDTVCDYFSSGPTATVLSTTNFENKDKKLQLFPNPTTGKVAFEDTSINIKNVNIYDNVGRLIKNISSDTIDLTELNEGIYFVSITTDLNTYTQKIIVKK